jgi:hypothetical protein
MVPDFTECAIAFAPPVGINLFGLRLVWHLLPCQVKRFLVCGERIEPIVTPCIGIYFFTVYSLGACQRASIYTCSLYCRRSMFEDRCLMLCFLEAGLVLIRPTSDLLALKCRKEDRAEYVLCEGVKNYTAVMRFWGSVGVVSLGCSILFPEQFTSAVRRGIIEPSPFPRCAERAEG